MKRTIGHACVTLATLAYLPTPAGAAAPPDTTRPYEGPSDVSWGEGEAGTPEEHAPSPEEDAPAPSAPEESPPPVQGPPSPEMPAGPAPGGGDGAPPAPSAPEGAPPEPPPQEEGSPEDDGFFVEDLSEDEEALEEALAVPKKSVRGEKGIVRGRVVSAVDGEPITGAIIEAVGTDYRTKSLADGHFELELPVGVAKVRVREDTHQPRVFEGVEIEPGGEQTLRVELRPMAGAQETVVVKAQMRKESEGARMKQRMEAVEARDIMSRDEIKRAGGGSTSAVARRIVGATIIDGKYLFVRGLGHRYGNTLLDRARVPSPEPDLRTVPLDIFPSSALSAINVQKTFTPDVPADFAGASAQLESRDVPDEWVFGVGASVGANTATTGRERVTHAGFAGADAFAFGNLPRALPDAIPKDTKVDRNAVDDNFNQVFSQADMERFGEAMDMRTQVTRAKGMPNLGAKLTLGYGHGVGRAGKLGFLLAANYSHKTQNRNGKIRQFGLGMDGSLFPQVDYDTSETVDNAAWSTMGLIKWDLGEHHDLTVTTLYSRDGEDKTRLFRGKALSVSGDAPIEATRLRYIMRSILFTRLGGSHEFPKAHGLKMSWFGSYSQARRDDPHLREMLFTQADPSGPFQYDAGNDAGKVTFLKLLDHTESGALDFELPFKQWTGIPANVRAGAWVEGKQRVFGVRRFSYQAVNTLVDQIPSGTGNVINPDTVGGGPGPGATEPFFIQENTRPNDSYRAEQEIYAGYASLELPLVRWMKVAGGLRFEASNIDLRTFNIFDPEAEPDQASLRDRDPLPSVSIIFSPTRRQNIRLVGTRTLARPEFRELAPFTFTDFVGGFDVQGNKFLRSTKIWNADLRWEFFPSATEVVAVSAFYKYFDAPIERVSAPRIPPLASFLNARRAQSVGGELELRKNLQFLVPRGAREQAGGEERPGREARRAKLRAVFSQISVGANFAYIWSRVELPNDRMCAQDDESCKFEQLFDVSTSRKRPMQGQAPFVLNAYLAYDNDRSGTHARALYNTFGRYIQQVSGLGLPDIYYEPVHDLDFTFSQRVYKGLSVSASVNNALNWRVRWTQGDQVARSYRLGTTFTLGVAYDL